MRLAPPSPPVTGLPRPGNWRPWASPSRRWEKASVISATPGLPAERRGEERVVSRSSGGSSRWAGLSAPALTRPLRALPVALSVGARAGLVPSWCRASAKLWQSAGRAAAKLLRCSRPGKAAASVPEGIVPGRCVSPLKVVSSVKLARLLKVPFFGNPKVRGGHLAGVARRVRRAGAELVPDFGRALG